MVKLFFLILIDNKATIFKESRSVTGQPSSDATADVDDESDKRNRKRRISKSKGNPEFG